MIADIDHRRSRGRSPDRTKSVLTSDTNAVLLAVRVRPRASNAGIAGERSGRLLVHVTAPPIDGRANQAVCKLLAKGLGVARGTVRIVGGERSRDKLVRIEGLTAAEVAERLSLAAP
jgi:uncharacterized protein